MKFSRSSQEEVTINLTPLIDIVFLLIFFFMVAAQFAQQAHVNLNLPDEAGEQKKDKPVRT